MGNYKTTLGNYKPEVATSRMELVEKWDTTATTSKTFTITNAEWSKYSSIWIDFALVSASNITAVVTINGVTGTAYDWVTTKNATGTITGASTNNGAGFDLSSTTTMGYGPSGFIHLVKNATWITANWQISNKLDLFINGGGMLDTVADITEIKFTFNANVSTGGYITIYKVKAT